MVGWVDLFPESLRSRNFAMLYFVFGLSRYRFALPRQVVFGLWSLVIGYWFWLLVLGFEFRVLGFGSPCPPVAPSPCPQVSLSPLLPFTPSPRLPVSLVFGLWSLVFLVIASLSRDKWLLVFGFWSLAFSLWLLVFGPPVPPSPRPFCRPPSLFVQSKKAIRLKRTAFF